MADTEPTKEKSRRNDDGKKAKTEVGSGDKHDKDASPERRNSRKSSMAKSSTSSGGISASPTKDNNYELILSQTTNMFEKLSGSISQLSETMKTIVAKQAKHDAILAGEDEPPKKRGKFSHDQDDYSDGETDSEPDDVIDQINQLLCSAPKRSAERNENDSKSNAEKLWLADLAMELVNEEQKSAPITPELAKILEDILPKKLSDEKLKVKLDAYPAPENITGFSLPKVNPEVWSKIKADTRSRDIRMQKAQQRVVRGLTPLAQLAEKLLLAQRSESQVVDIEACLTLALTSFAMIANGNIEISLRRREMIRPDLNLSYRELCAASTPMTDMLFGDDLARVVKDIKETNQVATKVVGYGSYIKGQSRFANKGKSLFGGYRKPFNSGQQGYRPPKNYSGPSFKKGKCGTGAGAQQNRR